MSHTKICLLLVSCAIAVGTVHADCVNLDRYVVIKSQKSGLVLVADEVLKLVTIQPFEQNVSNQFQLQTGSTIGRFHIFHRSSGLVLDVIDYPTGGYIASLSQLSDSVTQEFHVNSDGAIVSAAYPSYALGVRNGDFTPGNLVMVSPYTENNLESEKFSLEFAESKHFRQTAI